MTDVFDGYHDHFDAAARLVILKALANEQGYSLNDTMVMGQLHTFAINRGRDYVRTQLAFLAGEAGAVILRTAGTAIIATLTEAGLDHVQHRRVLSGVAKPSPVRG
ncbi:MAG: VpaChn25_0724 family phage protein [Paracoccaceae bacterium]